MIGDHLKVVTTLHGTDITILGHDPSLRDLIRMAIHQSDAVTAVSHDLLMETYEVLAINKPIDLVYNFVDPRDYAAPADPQLRAQFAEPNEKILLHMSNFRPVKRIMDVIDIFARVHEKVPSRLMFVGEGPELTHAVNRIRELGLSDRVHYLGKQNNIAEIIAMSDLLLLPSEKESFGLVALEAMAGGVPTIGSNAGGIPEVIQHGENGYLAPVGNTEEMAAYAIRLLTDPILYQQFSAAGVNCSQTKFSAELIAKQYEQIYYRVAQPNLCETAMSS
jgi:N-acetyl-alpha-D-glucosaminyl L-malate synthase BshA